MAASLAAKQATLVALVQGQGRQLDLQSLWQSTTPCITLWVLAREVALEGVNWDIVWGACVVDEVQEVDSDDQDRKVRVQTKSKECAG